MHGQLNAKSLHWGFFRGFPKYLHVNASNYLHRTKIFLLSFQEILT